MLIENTLWGETDKVKIAIERLKHFEPEEGYYVAFSGGKDSCVVKDLVIKSGVKHEFHFNRSMEPPELIYYIRKHHADVIWHRPKKTMWELIVKNMTPPTRILRFCCKEMKENDETAIDRLVVTGVRWEESTQRKGRQMVEQCRNNTGKRYLHPIIDWTETDVWEYIRQNKLPYCKLYDEGWTRLGCVLCPNSGPNGLKRDAERFPKIAEMYRYCCNVAYPLKVISKAKKGETVSWKSGDDMYDWWLSGAPGDNSDDPQQRFFFED